MKKIFSFILLFTFFAQPLLFSTLALAQEAIQTTSEQSQPIQNLEDISQNLQKSATKQFNSVKNIIDMVLEYIVKYSFQAVGGLIVLFLGWMASGYVGNIIQRFFEKKSFDITLTKFIISGIRITIMVFAVMVALGKFGIEIAPLIAGLSVIGFGTSFALQGPLSNYAAGFTLIMTRPFKVGDIVEVADVTGEITDIKLPRTELITVDGHRILVPNNKIIGEIIENYSNTKRLNLSIGISYDSDVDQAITLIKEVLNNDKRVVTEKKPKIGIDEFADSSINIMIRLFCKQTDYWDVKFDLNKKIFASFNDNKITIPFPQRDVHVFNANVDADFVRK